MEDAAGVVEVDGGDATVDDGDGVVGALDVEVVLLVLVLLFLLLLDVLFRCCWINRCCCFWISLLPRTLVR